MRRSSSASKGSQDVPTSPLAVLISATPTWKSVRFRDASPGGCLSDVRNFASVSTRFACRVVEAECRERRNHPRREFRPPTTTPGRDGYPAPTVAPAQSETHGRCGPRPDTSRSRSRRPRHRAVERRMSASTPSPTRVGRPPAPRVGRACGSPARTGSGGALPMADSCRLPGLVGARSGM
jgi:hypothetical protein